MPQGPLSSDVAINPSNQRAAVTIDGAGNLLTGSGSATKLNISTTTVIKAGAGRVVKLIFNAASTTAPAVYDYAAATGFAAANQIWVGGATTAAQTIVVLDAPVSTGIVVVPGGATVAVIYD